MAHLWDRTTWRLHLEGKGSQEIAEAILANMSGYKSGSKWRRDDLDGLRSAIESVIDITNERYVQRLERAEAVDPLPGPVERLLAMTDDEIMAHAAAEGIDIDAEIARLRGLVVKAIRRADGH